MESNWMYSITTERKIKKIEETLGPSWKENNPNKSIDSLYINIVEDNRENLFCKVPPGTKQMLKELVDSSDNNMAELLHSLIHEAYQNLICQRKKDADDLAHQFSQSER